MQKKLTQLQGFNAMAKLFQIYYDLDPSGDIGAILGSMSFLQDKKTADGAMLDDWQDFLDTQLKHKNLRNYNHLTALQAFVAMGDFLEFFFSRNNITWEIKLLLDSSDLARDKKKIDPVVWQNWLRCVDEVLTVKDSREYFYLLPKE